MKRLLLIFVLTIIALPTIHLSAQTSNVSTKLIRAFETGNVELLATLLNDNVELVIPNTENFFTKQQAKSILADFFRKNPVVDFNVLHKGTKENASFLIGTLVSSRGSFRVSVFARKNKGESLVYQLRIEDPNE